MPIYNDHGVELWYQVEGEGPPLVLTGGFGLLHDQWERVQPILKQNFTCIDWHYRGVGKSDRSWPGGYPMDRWVDDLELILEHLGIEQTHMWGTSTGSYLSIRYASKYQRRVKSLITYPFFKTTPPFRQTFDAFCDICELFGYEALGRFTQWIGCAEKNVFGGMANEMALFEIASFKRNFSIESLRKTLDQFNHADLTADVEKLDMPVCLLLGESGNLGAQQDATKGLIADFQAICPQAELVILPDAGGTYCMIEEPEITAAAVKTWLEKIG